MFLGENLIVFSQRLIFVKRHKKQFMLLFSGASALLLEFSGQPLLQPLHRQSRNRAPLTFTKLIEHSDYYNEDYPNNPCDRPRCSHQRFAADCVSPLHCPQPSVSDLIDLPVHQTKSPRGWSSARAETATVPAPATLTRSVSSPPGSSRGTPTPRRP